jgi:hypothetical protein
MYDAQGVEHRVKLRAESVYEAALASTTEIQTTACQAALNLEVFEWKYCPTFISYGGANKRVLNATELVGPAEKESRLHRTDGRPPPLTAAWHRRASIRLKGVIAKRKDSLYEAGKTYWLVGEVHGEASVGMEPWISRLHPELRIRVNHKDLFVPIGGMVQEALNLPNEADPPPTLRVLRPFHGRLIPINFDKPSRDILNLVLLPGDQITF